jgi:formyltetrahydrofolate deformylase
VKNSAVLLVQCPDRKGLDAAISEFLYRQDGNILNFEQHSAGQERFYHARVEWDLSGFKLDLDQFDVEFGPVAQRFGMNWSVALSSHRPRVAIFVSKYDHCLVLIGATAHYVTEVLDIRLVVGPAADRRPHHRARRGAHHAQGRCGRPDRKGP